MLSNVGNTFYAVKKKNLLTEPVSLQTNTGTTSNQQNYEYYIQ